LALLEEQGGSIEIVDYLNTPPSISELDGICTKLGLEPMQLIRTKEPLFKELGLSKKDPKSRKEWLGLMVDNPKLIERPIVLKGKRAALGRPPESVLDIL
jgi:arsenate reductase